MPSTKIKIVHNGNSNFAIVLSQNTPTSVQRAAEELQECLEIATGIKLPVCLDVDYDRNEYLQCISLGRTDICGFRIREYLLLHPTRFSSSESIIYSHEGDIFLIGAVDTPDGKTTINGGTRNDTANATYTFLEDFLGVRWLMPGKTNRIIPKIEHFTLEDPIHKTISTNFNVRQVCYLQNSEPEVVLWTSRHQLTNEVQLNCGHSWNRIVPAELFESHPEWFALRDGKRSVTSRHKIETTNQELVKYIAAQAVQHTQNNNNLATFSLSPTDMYEFSESTESLSFYEPVPEKHPSVTRLIAKFYNDVSNEVLNQCDYTRLSGFLYSCYINPPMQEIEKFPKNFYPVIAPTPNYGFRLYRLDARQNFEKLLRYWSSKTDNLYYYDLPNWFRENSFLVAPPAVEIIDIVFDLLVKYKVKGLMIYGMETWSQAALGNYILAKKVCSPSKEALPIRNEWLDLAYGKRAGAEMKHFYDYLETIFRDYYNEHPEAIYQATPELMRDLYAKHFRQIEKKFLDAYECKMDDLQQTRIQLIAENLGGLGWWLKKRNFIDSSENLAFEKSDDEIEEMLQQKHDGIKKFPKPPMMFYKD